jgi:hypothetical protein
VCRLRNPGKRECRPCFHYPPTLRPKITDDARDHSLSKAPREAPQTADVLKKPNVHTTTQRLPIVSRLRLCRGWTRNR